MATENYKLIVEMLDEMKKSIDSLKTNISTRLREDYKLSDEIIDASLPYKLDEIKDMKEDELVNLFRKYSIGSSKGDITVDEMRETFTTVKNMSLLLLSTQKEYDNVKKQSTEIMDEYLNYMSSEKINKARNERLTKMKEIYESTTDEFEKKRIHKMIDTIETSVNFSFLQKRFDTYGKKEVNNIMDAYFDRKKGEIINNKYETKIKQYGYNPEIFSRFFNIEETFLPEEYHDLNNIFLFIYLRMVAYSDPYKDDDKMYIRALTGAMAELFYHKMDPEKEKNFIEAIKAVDDHFMDKIDYFKENNTTSPNHPVRQAQKKSIEQRRLAAIKNKLRELKYPGVYPEDITADELTKIFDEYVDKLINEQVETNTDDNTEINEEIVQDVATEIKNAENKLDEI